MIKSISYVCVVRTFLGSQFLWENLPDFFDFFNDKLSPPSPVHCATVFDKSIIIDFLHDMGYDPNQRLWPYRRDLESEVRHIINTWDLNAPTHHHLLAILPLAVNSISTAAPLGSTDLKIYQTIYALLFFYLDNMIEKRADIIISELRKLPERYGLGLLESEYADQGLTLFLRHVTLETRKHYGPYSSGAIIKATLDFLIGTIVEREVLQDPGLKIPPSAARCPGFFRAKVGLGEIYGHLMFPEELAPEAENLGTYFLSMPDLRTWTDAINDIMSFYKESVVGDEKCTYIMFQARMLGCSPVEILRDMCKEIVELTGDINHTLAVNPVVRRLWDEYRTGFIMARCGSKRYRLDEIGILPPPRECY